MGWISSTKKQLAEAAAVKAREAGQMVYVHRINVAVMQSGISGPLVGFGQQIEAIEAAGPDVVRWGAWVFPVPTGG